MFLPFLFIFFTYSLQFFTSKKQAATAPPLGASDLDGLMSHAQRRRLVSEAVQLRSLIRVKIADNADLEQASKSVSAIDTFMYRVKQTANAMNIEPYTLFQRL